MRPFALRPLLAGYFDFFLGAFFLALVDFAFESDFLAAFFFFAIVNGSFPSSARVNLLVYPLGADERGKTATKNSRQSLPHTNG